MGLTKQYLRYVSAGNFNIITDNKCNAQFVTLDGQEGRYVAVGAQENIIIWDFRLGDKAQILSGEKAQVAKLCASANERHLAAGYTDGTVHVYDLKTADTISVYSGHRNEITALCYDAFGHKLASGASDTDIIVWDTVTENGLCRLSGHKEPITHTIFLNNRNILISSSKDSYVKFWDLDMQHCFRTLIGHRTEVWSLALMKDDRYLVTGCGDAELRVWKLSWLTDEEKKTKEVFSKTLQLNESPDEDTPNYPLQCAKVGSLLRVGQGRVFGMVFDKTGQILACHGTDKQIEFFYFCTEEEATVRMKKRIKKQQMRENANKDEIHEVSQDVMEISLRDSVKRLSCLKTNEKLRSLDVVMGHGTELRVAVSLATNALEMYNVMKATDNWEHKLLRSISTHGHRTDVRAVTFSSDSLAIASGSADSVKLWNRPSQVCLRTVNDTGPVLSLCFAPGDRHVLAGLENGQLLIVDVASADILENIAAHNKHVWSVCVLPDLSGCVSGSSDCTVKFWSFELVNEKVDVENERGTKVLSLLHTRTLKLENGVLSVKITPNSKFVLVALLDSTVKIFFLDTFKFHMSLYGHKMPVLCMDISSDSNLVATGSSDNNIKLWGLDFGDCHKTLFAHDGPVTGLNFVPRTHHFFSCGKDGTIKVWDGDSHVKIMSVQGHVSDARGLVVSLNGKHIISCGTDRVLRLFERTEEILVLSDEQEEERENRESDLVTGVNVTPAGQPGLNLPTRRTVGSEKAADNILECLEICNTFMEQAVEQSLTQLPALMIAYQVDTPEDLLIQVVRMIRSSDLEEALLLIPFTSACQILKMLPKLLKRVDHTELLCRLLLFLLKLHHTSLIATKSLLPVLQTIEKLAIFKVSSTRELFGFNLNGMRYYQNQIEITENVQMFRDISRANGSKVKKRKQQEKIKRSLIIMS